MPVNCIADMLQNFNRNVGFGVFEREKLGILLHKAYAFMNSRKTDLHFQQATGPGPCKMCTAQIVAGLIAGTAQIQK